MREISNLRQDDMATLTGLSQSFLSMLESGDRKLTNIDKVVMLLDGLDVPVELTGPMLRNLAEVRCVQHAPPQLLPA
ncbi:helix-turn-helix transcriptional regulator [Streptomyces sp. S.PB5]|uniref:helix-turn-helix domain-containing protein n=1 Tax=Streptomyces sp. S.PB5 TaxID=3020844 RepID=UPI0025AEF6DE|nr:helix-turn-helix transcriptional regulator [Streptomyces sp. S.PB5]MDN3025652.1 helix-turn-helix transcriptional regulator [Streptomyces sp. S.PB5]